MINVAGMETERADKILAEELRMAGINVVEHEDVISHPEVHTHISGELNGWKFRRNWYYWTCAGEMPIEQAREIYATEAGRKFVRAGGDCTCIPPDSYVKKWIMPDGRTVAPASEEAKFKDFIDKGLFSPETIDKYAFSDDPESIGARAVVTIYDVDELLGLYMLAEKIKELGVVDVL